MSTKGFQNFTAAMVEERNKRIVPGAILRRPGKVADAKPLPPLDTAAARIGAPVLTGRKVPTNRRNDGRAFENALEVIFTRYSAHNLMRLRKAEPPCKVMGFGAGRRVIFLKNPFLDFIGLWNERAGRFVALEAKSTSKPLLPLDSDSGVTEAQVEALRWWTVAGGVAAVLWEHRGEVKLVMPLTIVDTLRSRRSLQWEKAGRIIKPGLGLERWQILAALRSAFPA